MTFWPLSYISNLRLRQRDTLRLTAEDVATVRALAAMAPRHDLPGLHYVAPFHASKQVEYWSHLRVVQPQWITVLGAQELAGAQQFAEGVANDPIRTRVIFRHWVRVGRSESDNGRLSVLTPDEWMFALAPTYQDKTYHVMPDNEGFGVNYGAKLAKLIALAAENNGPRLAVGAWPSHNPPRDTWPSYLPMFEALYRWPHLAVYAPHIYYSRAPSVENLDGFRLVRDMLAYVEREMTAPVPFEVVISELGRCVNKDGRALDANRGYSYEIDSHQYADETIRLTQHPRWHFCTFSMGAWGDRDSFGVGADYLSDYEGYATGYVTMPAPDGWLSEDGTMPINEYQEIVAHTINGTTQLNVRKAADASSAWVGLITDGDTVGVQPAVQGADYGHGNQWYPVRLTNGVEGYAAAYWLTIAETVPEPDEEDTTPLPPAPSEYVTQEELTDQLIDLEALLRAELIDAMAARDKQLRKDVADLIVDLIKIGGNAQIAAQNRITEFIEAAA